MLIVSSREFRSKQKMYLDLVDKNEQVIVHRGKNKAYSLNLISEAESFFSDPKVKRRVEQSIKQAKEGKLTTLPKEGIDSLLGI